MNCTNHPENEATGACVYCGKFFCKDCLVEVSGKNYCRDCVSKAFEDTKNLNNLNGAPNININNVSTSTSNSVANANANANGVGGFQVSPKSRLVATLLCVFVGYFGIHQFYAGKIGMGILYLFTGGLCGIGWIIDIVLLLVGSFRDGYGMYIKTW